MGYRMQSLGVLVCGSSTHCWIGLLVRLIVCSICGAFALVALAPPICVYAVSDNDIDSEVDSGFEITLPVETEIESSDLPDSESQVDPDYNDSVSDNSTLVESGSESESFNGSASLSSNDVIYNIDLYNAYDAYDGSISSTYLEYMRGFLSKLDWDEHYVAARVSRYDYIFAFSADLAYNGVFTGSDVVVVKWSTATDNPSYTVTVESTFSLDAGSILVYTDLSHQYPSLASSSDISLRQIVIFLAISVTVWTVGSFLRRNPVASRRKRRWYP
nr:unnamed protein product [uncultured bacterium]